MIKYLLSATNTYRVHTVEDAEALHEELKNNSNFELVAFSRTTKYIKEKREIVDSYELCKAKIVFTDEKDPEVRFEEEYNAI